MAKSLESDSTGWADRVSEMYRRRLGINGVKGIPINEMAGSVLAAKIRAAFGHVSEPVSDSTADEPKQPPWWVY